MTDLFDADASQMPQAEQLGRFLLDHGVDLASAAAPNRLARGTSVYAHADADAVEILKRMAQAHVRMLFVVDGGAVVGVVDAVELAARTETLVWTRDELSPGTKNGR